MTENVLVTDLDDYQADAMRTANNEGDYDIRLAAAALGLTGEAGEAAEIVKKYIAHGHPLDTVALVKELGDILWYVARAADLIDMRLSRIASLNIAKLRARYPEGFSTTESLKRCECGHHQDDHLNTEPESSSPCEQCNCVDYLQFVRVA